MILLTYYKLCRALGTLNLSEVQLKGIADALEKNKGPNVEAKGVKAHFNMDESGMLQLLGAELSFEKTVTEAEEKAKQDAEDLDSTLSKLGSTISKLFSGDEQKAEASNEEKVEDSDGATPTTTTPAPAAQNDSAPVEPPKPKVSIIKESLNIVEEKVDMVELSGDKFSSSKEK